MNISLQNLPNIFDEYIIGNINKKQVINVIKNDLLYINLYYNVLF